MESSQYLYTIDDLCEIFHCAKSTIWRWVSSGTFPKPIKIGGLSRWTQAAVLGVIEVAEENKNASAQPIFDHGKKIRLSRVKISRR
ncbi:helix-turn-helix transcriptional regulator [Gemmobacter caeni]|uniref:helix-turn-helix transcriptional regulator n=1 Tax=Gemmobacter caeni TaxID=589035 RepID=UPI001315599F|nr:helix-turn-helix domain-containing protein [Gemmobacter caeni]